MRGIPYIRFVNACGTLYIECDGETVGKFYPDERQNRGEDFMRRMESLKMLVNDEVVDTFKYIDKVTKENPVKVSSKTK